MKKFKLFQALFGSRNTATAHFAVEGMNCGSCAAKVEKAIRQLPGIASVNVDLATGRVAVEHEPEKATPEQIRQQIVAAGYAANVSAQ